MIDRTNNIVTKWGRTDWISLMRLQSHCKQEPFPNKLEGQTMSRFKPVVNLLSEACTFVEAFLHQKPYSVDMLAFRVFFFFFHASPTDFNTAATTVWHQNKIQQRNEPSFFFRFPGFEREGNVPKNKTPFAEPPEAECYLGSLVWGTSGLSGRIRIVSKSRLTNTTQLLRSALLY